METTINVKTKKINVMYGFFNDNNYGVYYPELTKRIELSMILPYLNKGEVDVTNDYGMFHALYAACRDLKKQVKDNYTIYATVRTIKYEPTIDVTFRIEKKRLTLEEAVEHGNELIRDYVFAEVCGNTAEMDRITEARKDFENSLIADYGEDFATDYFNEINSD